jgi:hypothetical protein
MNADIKEKVNNINLNFLKKPIILTGLICITFFIWFFVLASIDGIVNGFNKEWSVFKIQNSEYITCFLSFISAIFSICLFYNAKFKEKLKNKQVLKISFYLALIGLFIIELEQNFSIPFSDMNTIDWIINDIIILTIIFLILFCILWINNKISFTIRDFPFHKIFSKKVFSEIFNILIRFFKAMFLNH